MNEAVVILITVPSTEVGKQIANELLERKLAACVNIFPAFHSIYRWQGKIITDEEVLLLVKTRRELVADLVIPAVKEIHPYEVPEIIALPVMEGSKSYLDWIQEETQ
jgi:periplasmic divalent cation tolerance protein